MKILLVSFLYPPAGTVGSLRIGSMVKYLKRAGHELQVLAGADLPLPQGAPDPGVPVLRVPWWSVNDLPKKLLQKSHGIILSDSSNASSVVQESSPRLQKAMQKYRALTNLPDEAIGWYRPALKEGRKLLQSFKPELILSSAPHYTSLLVAVRLAEESGLPLVTEFRDLWAGNAVRTGNPLRSALDRRLEKRILARSDGLVAVSDPITQLLQGRLASDVPARTYSHGFDADEYTVPVARPLPLAEPGLHLVYTGMLYQPRDPLVLLHALAGLRERGTRVTLHMLGRYHENLDRRIAATGTADLVRSYGHQPHSTVVQWQSHADLLLLFLWPVPEEKGNFSGKIFEYAGANRPIFALGMPGQDVAADLITDNQLGTIADGVEDISEKLTVYWQQKLKTGSIPPPSEEGRLALSCGPMLKPLEEVIRLARSRRQKLNS